MTKDHLRQNLLNSAIDLRDWFAATLEIREERSSLDIEKITSEILDTAYDEGIADDELFFIWNIFEDCIIPWSKSPNLIKSDTGLELTPELTAAEYSLGVGLVLSLKAAECLKTNSHKQHLLSSILLFSVSEARNYWLSTRGITQCRNPVDKFVKIETTIKEIDFEREDDD